MGILHRFYARHALRMWDVETTTPYFLPGCVLMIILGALLPPFLRWLGS